MKISTAPLVAATLFLAALTNVSLANDKQVVQTFYDLLSNPASEEHVAAFKNIAADDWESIGNYSGVNKNTDKFLGQVGGFGKLIPDLNWNVQQMIQEGNQIVVRSRATGTPAGPLFGVDGKGKGFDILTIDIHTVESGKIVRSYHVEDWAGALRQLSAN
ncbi:MAG: ester cyclase [Acidiferrobacterales bacterium]|nr:ester cyclase [Acidiferrobacterales bacterium]